MSDEDWVARLLQDVAPPAMPDDVSARLERTIRQEVEAQQATAGPDDRAVEDTAGRAAGAGAGPAAGQDAAGRPPTAPVPPTAPAPARPAAAGPAWAEQGERPDPDGLSILSGPRTTGSTRRELRREDVAERRRRMLARLAPVAAGLLVLGGAGAVALSTLGGSDSEESATLEASGGAEDTSVPRALVATGTEYTTTDDEVFAQQVRELVAVAGSGEAALGAGTAGATDGDAGAADSQAEAAGGEAMTDAGGDAADEPAGAALESAPGPAAARSAVDSPLTDRETFQACVDEVTDNGTTPATAVDLAVVDGLESTVVVVPDPSGENLFVYVVGPDCTDVDGPGFKFRQVTP